jgi:hypothetical protein
MMGRRVDAYLEGRTVPQLIRMLGGPTKAAVVTRFRRETLSRWLHGKRPSDDSLGRLRAAAKRVVRPELARDVVAQIRTGRDLGFSGGVRLDWSPGIRARVGHDVDPDVEMSDGQDRFINTVIKIRDLDPFLSAYAKTGTVTKEMSEMFRVPMLEAADYADPKGIRWVSAEGLEIE